MGGVSSTGELFANEEWLWLRFVETPRSLYLGPTSGDGDSGPWLDGGLGDEKDGSSGDEENTLCFADCGMSSLGAYEEAVAGRGCSSTDRLCCGTCSCKNRERPKLSLRTSFCRPEVEKDGRSNVGEGTSTSRAGLPEPIVA